MWVRATLAAVLLFAGCGTPAMAQQLPLAANLPAVVAFPGFYTDRTIVVRGHLRQMDSRLSFEDEEGHRVLALWRPQERPEGNVEATGQLWDLGRMKQDDARLAGFDVSPIVKASGQDWPRPGDVFVFAVTRSAPVESPAPVSTVRSLVLEGPHAVGRLVTVPGQFRGRNLFGDLPKSPGISKSDFVLRSSEAAIWVCGLAPKGKGFDLDPDKRVDTDQWLRVNGTVREANGLMWIEAKSIALSERDATQTDAPAAASAPATAVPPPEVVFSVPAPDESDVSPATTVRVQLSRDIDPKTLQGHVRVFYVPTAPGAPTGTPPDVTLDVNERDRILTLKFAAPLQRFQKVRVELTDGIKGTDGQAMKPWGLTFTVGGQEP